MNYQIEQLPTVLSKKVPNLIARIAPPVTDIAEAGDAARGQYHSTRIIAILENQDSLARFERILGVTSVDLYNPNHRADGGGFVFGEARLQGRSGIVSTFRLRAGQPSYLLYDTRVKKEVVHELGHMVGLDHCPSRNCVMSRSENVNDTDTKSDIYCDNCESVLKELRY